MSVPRNITHNAISFWAPRGVVYTAVRPRLWRSAWHAPVSICIEPASGAAHSGHDKIVRCSYDPLLYGRRVLLTFRSHDVYRRLHARWRILANALWKLIQRRPDAVFADIPVDISDCGDATIPADVFRFVKRPGDPHDLLPNLHLLGPRQRLARPLPWAKKTDTVYFRGAATGSGRYEQNPRVAVCLVARGIHGADCKLTSFSQVETQFTERLREDGVVSRKDRPSTMNRHRYLIDVDGNTSSWDRFMLIGSFGGLPIRFETTWQECWHSSITDGEHFVSATRDTLPAVVEEMRSSPQRSQAIAAAATRIALEVLCPRNIQQLFEQIWLARIG